MKMASLLGRFSAAALRPALRLGAPPYSHYTFSVAMRQDKKLVAEVSALLAITLFTSYTVSIGLMPNTLSLHSQV